MRFKFFFFFIDILAQIPQPQAGTLRHTQTTNVTHVHSFYNQPQAIHNHISTASRCRRKRPGIEPRPPR